MRYSEFIGQGTIDKQASIASTIAAFRAGVGALEGWQRLLLGTVILGSGLTGGIAGTLAAKGTAHTTADFNLAKKEYHNEQAKADIGQLTRKLNQEYKAAQEAYQPKSVRLLNA